VGYCKPVDRLLAIRKSGGIIRVIVWSDLLCNATQSWEKAILGVFFLHVSTFATTRVAYIILVTWTKL
jgi:hypothetical protein